MKKIYLLFFVALMAMQFNARAERINIPGLEVPKLIITEVRPDAASSAYVELTNMGDTPIDLKGFTLHSVHYNTRCTEYSDSAISFNRLNSAVDNTIGKVFLEGVLQPGESFVVANVWDANDARGSGVPIHNTAIAQIGNQFAHRDEALNVNGWIDMPEWQCFGRDSVNIDKTYNARDWFVRGEETAGYLLHWVFETDSATMDSTYIDQFNHFYFPDENTANGININMKGFNIYPIAGVVDAMTTSVMVRKPNITEGNLNWNQSRGVDATTSEWLVIPKNTSTDMAFNTVGSHGSYDLDFTVKDPTKIIVDDNELSVPWEMVRGDSLARYFNLGEGMSWSYDLVASFEDTASYIARPGDKFSLYAVGEVVKSWDFTLRVREPEPDVALVFPRRRLVEEMIITDDGSGAEGAIDTTYIIGWSNNFVYELAKGPNIDSIVNVPFAARIDTLFKYLDKPEKATWEFVYVDGVERVDLKFGDKLKVTSEDGSNTKEYFVAVNDHVMSDNTVLSAVTWPDIDKDMYPRWNRGDTLPEFTELKTNYVVELRFDAQQIPAFQFIPQDLRSRIEVVNATSLSGNAEQRTTSVTLTSESDTVSTTYNFVFEKQGTPVQPLEAEPFISEWVHGITTQGWAVEIYNPGNQDLDLSQYMFVSGSMSQTWQEAVQTVVSTTNQSGFIVGAGNKSYNTHYVPSKRWVADYSWEAWQQVPDEENPYVGPGFLRDDNQTDPWVAGGDVWVMGIGMNTNAYQTKIRQESDFLFRGTGESTAAWDSLVLLHRETVVWNNPGHNNWLLKILNDSILDGTKDVRDPSAYELIDRWEIVGDSVAGRDNVKGMNWSFKRKPSVQKGTLERMGGANETAESSEWEIHKTQDFDFNNNLAVANLGIHSMDPITNYLSTVTSVKLLVTPGYRGDNLSITGNVADYTPTSISMVLDKADDSQSFAFMRGDTEIGAEESLADGDMLVVTSGDGQNITNYKLINEPLDDDTSISAVDGSGLTITDNMISGLAPGATLKDVLANLQAGDNAIVNVLDANGALQPLSVMGVDSMYADVLASDKVFIEVVAQNNEKVTYSFDLGLASSDAVLWSNVLRIDQETKLIKEFPMSLTAPGFLEIVYANEGAIVNVIDKGGQERMTGFMNIDDRIVVTAADGVTKVIYRFSEDLTVSVKPLVSTEANDVVIFPNPVNSILNIQGFELETVQVYSLSGTMMIHKSAAYSNRVDVSILPDGIYIIKMTDVNGSVAIDKFLKK